MLLSKKSDSITGHESKLSKSSMGGYAYSEGCEDAKAFTIYEALEILKEREIGTYYLEP